MIEEAVSRLWIMSLQSCCLIMIVLIARFLLKRYPKVYSYCLWILVGIRLLCPISIESPFSLQPDIQKYFIQEQIETGGDKGQTVIFSNIQSDEKPDTQGMQSIQDYSLISKNSEADMLGSEYITADAGNKYWFTILFLIYVTGAAVCICVYLFQYLIVKHRVSTAILDKDNIWLCETISQPFVMGIIHPRIFLPYDLSNKEKDYVLKHEQTHIRHHDPFIRMLGMVCICIHWWNPLVWLAVYKMYQDMEMYCDEGFMSSSSISEKKEYAKLLLSFAENKSIFSIKLAFGQSNTERRIKSILNKKRGNVIVACTILMLAVLSAFSFLTVPKKYVNDVISESIKTDNLRMEEYNEYFVNASINGKWIVTGYILPRIYALSNEEIEGYIGTELIYDSSSFMSVSYTTKQNICGYYQELVIAREVEEMYHVNLAASEISAAAFRYYEAQGIRDPLFGAYIYMIDEDNALIDYEGVLFIAKRET